MKLIRKDNFNTLADAFPKHNGWLFGQFMPEDTLLNDHELEIKWSKLNKGDKSTKPHGVTKGKSIGILIRGHVRVTVVARYVSHTRSTRRFFNRHHALAID